MYRGSAEYVPTSDAGAVAIARMRNLAEFTRVQEQVGALRGNLVHAVIFHKDGGIEDLGVSKNLRTDGGDDWQSGQMGGFLGNNTGTPATATSATSLTTTGTPLTISALKGRRIRIDANTYGNVVDNTTSVITVDQWWTVADGVAATPGATAPFSIEPGFAPARFIGLTENAVAPGVTDTALAAELTTGAMGRALATYAHTVAALTYTLQKTFSPTLTFASITKAGMFTSLTGVGIMTFETLLNAVASVVSGDSLQVTWTVTT